MPHTNRLGVDGPPLALGVRALPPNAAAPRRRRKRWQPSTTGSCRSFAAQHWLVGVRRRGRGTAGRRVREPARVASRTMDAVDVGRVPTRRGALVLALDGCSHRSCAIGGRAVASPLRRCGAPRHRGLRPGQPRDLPSRGARAPAERPSRCTPAPTSIAAAAWSLTASQPRSCARTILDIGRRVGDDAAAPRHRVESPRADRTDWSDAHRHVGSPRPPRSPGHPTPAAGDRGQRRPRRGHRFVTSSCSSSRSSRKPGCPTPTLHHCVLDGEPIRRRGRPRLSERAGSPSSWTAAVHLRRRRSRERDLTAPERPHPRGWMVLRFSWRRYRTGPTSSIAEIRTAHSPGPVAGVARS